MRYLLLILALTGCANVGPKGYVTNEQLRFRIQVYCHNKAYESLKAPYNYEVLYEQCMGDFFYDVLPENMVRPEWRSK